MEIVSTSIPSESRKSPARRSATAVTSLVAASLRARPSGQPASERRRFASSGSCGVRLQPVGHAAGVGRGERGDRVGVALEDLVYEAFAVHGEVERLADFDVVHVLGVAVDQARHHAQGVYGDEVGVLGIDDPLGVCGRDLADDVYLTLCVADLLQGLLRVDVVYVDDLLQS